jgi:predicted permease
VSVGGDPVVVVGVLEPGFEAPEALMDAGVDLWRPLAWASPELTGTNYNVVRIVGRLGPGSSLASVQRQVDGLVERLAAEDGHYRTRDGAPRAVPVETLAEATTDDVREGLGLLLAAVTVLLLVACANVAHLFLARGLGRTREMAVRRALGAGSGALARLLLAESLLVGVAGGILGAGLAAGGLTAFLALTPAALPRSGSVAMDLRILAFAVGTATLTVLLFGLVPALRTARADLAERLRSGGRGATGGRRVAGLRNLLVAGEVALSLVLLAGALLLARSFATVRAQDPGFEPEGVWTAPLNPDPGTTEEYRALARDLTRAAADIPGVLHAAVGLTMPMELIGGNRCCWGTRLEVDGVPLDETRVAVHPVTGDYVPTLGIQLLAGRTWTAAEAEARPVPVLLSEPLARAAFGSPEAAVGRSVREGGEDAVPMTVVGVLADTRHYGLDEDHGPALYLPMEQVPFAPPRVHLAVRVAPGTAGGAGGGVGGALREAIWSVAPALPVPMTRPMEAWLARGTAERRFLGALFLSFAVVGLLLAAGGLYGTLLFVAGERRREMGIRLALGASRGRIERRLLMSGLAVSGVGVAAGLAGSWYGGRFLERWVWGVEPADPATLLLASAVLLATAAVASWFPARNAARTDPVRTLREE